MAFVAYDPEAFRVQVKKDNGSWASLKTARFFMSQNYNPENGVLIVDIETATMTIDYIGTTAYLPVASGDYVRARLGSRIIFNGQVDSTTNRMVGQSGAPKKLRYTFSATLVGVYASALVRTVYFPDLPKESAYKRMLRFVTITNLVVPDSESEVD